MQLLFLYFQTILYFRIGCRCLGNDQVSYKSFILTADQIFQCVEKTWCIFLLWYFLLFTVMTVSDLTSLHFNYVLGNKDLVFYYLKIKQGVSPNSILIKPVNQLLIFFVVVHVPFFSAAICFQISRNPHLFIFSSLRSCSTTLIS